MKIPATALVFMVTVLFFEIGPVFAQDSAKTAPHAANLHGYNEFGFVSGYQRYGRDDSQLDFVPFGIFDVFGISDHQFLQPFATFLFGAGRTYLHCGLKYGSFITETKDDLDTPLHYIWDTGLAYQQVWGIIAQRYGPDVSFSYPGFCAPFEFGVKWEFPKSKSALTFLGTIIVGNENENTQWGYGATVAYSWLSHSLMKQ